MLLDSCLLFHTCSSMLHTSLKQDHVQINRYHHMAPTSASVYIIYFLHADLIMKYFLGSFSPFHRCKKGSCQFLAKECAQYWLTTKRTMPQSKSVVSHWVDWVVKSQHKQIFIWRQIGSHAELIPNQRSIGTFSTNLYARYKGKRA